MRKEKLMMIFLLLSMMLIVGCGAKKSNLSQVGISMEDVPVESVSVKEVQSMQPAIASVVPSPIPTPVPVIIPNEIVDKVFIPSPTSTPTPVPSPTSTPEVKVIVNNKIDVNMPITQNNNVLKENESSSPTPTATATPVPTPTATVTPVPTPTATVTPVPTPTATVTPVPTPTVTVTPVPTPTAIVTPVPTPTATVTPVPTVSKLSFSVDVSSSSSEIGRGAGSLNDNNIESAWGSGGYPFGNNTWVKLKFSTIRRLTKMRFLGEASPAGLLIFDILGSNDDIKYFPIRENATAYAPTSNDLSVVITKWSDFIFSPEQDYKYIKVICKSWNGSWVAIREIELYGY